MLRAQPHQLQTAVTRSPKVCTAGPQPCCELAGWRLRLPPILARVARSDKVVHSQGRRALPPRQILRQCPSEPCSRKATSLRENGSLTRMSVPLSTLCCSAAMSLPSLLLNGFC